MRLVKTQSFSRRNPLPVCLAGLLALSLATIPSALGASPEDPARNGSAPRAAKLFDVPLFATPRDRLEGVLAKKDYVFCLPEHIRFEAGSEMVLSWQSSPLLLPEGSTMTVRMNERELTSVRLGAKKQAGAQERNSIVIPLSPEMLLPGWNRMSVSCLMQTTQSPCRDVDNPAAWLEFEAGSMVRVAFSGQPLFAEMQRFPESLTEPALMALPGFHPPGWKNQSEAVVSVLVPGDAGDPELRSLLIAAARLGQTVYTGPDLVTVKDTGTFGAESLVRNGILIGTRDALAETPLPGHVKEALRVLENGKGLLAEIITGDAETAGRRWIILSGADAAGLEKAALTLGSETAMNNVTANPHIVRQTPAISPLAERFTQPLAGPTSFQSLRDGGIVLRGLFRNQASRDISFPPGWQTTAGSFVDLDFTHAGGLDKTSAFDVRLNDTMIGSVALTPQNAAASRHRLYIPAGIAGRDPSRLSVSSYLDIGTVDCAHRNEERAWLSISSGSMLDINSTALTIDDLGRLGLLCLRDAFLRRTAIIVPSEQSAERNELLKIIGLDLGSRLPSMPVLWPEVATYAPDQPPEPDRVANRSGLILGSAFQWPQAFEKKPTLVIEGSPTSGDTVVLRGEPVPMADFDRSLSFAQLLPSPWTKEEIYATVGGLEGYGGNSTIALLTDPDVTQRLTGTVAALDSEGRLITYDVRYIQEVSLSEQFRIGFSRGTTRTDLEDRAMDQIEAGVFSSHVNAWIIGGALGALTLLFIVQKIIIRRRRNRPNGGDL